ncbi:kinase-like protein [Hypoxylon sp. NC0597]|nr:kinase-like protein [Hypoxylon sp. NC0597]
MADYFPCPLGEVADEMKADKYTGMFPENVCSFCSSTPKDQARTDYDSTIKLFYASGNHGTWSLGTRYILKERPAVPRSREADNLRFLAEKTTIPVPKVEADWVDEKTGKQYLMISRIEGVTLDKLWICLKQEDKQRIAQQVAGYLQDLYELTFDPEEPIGDNSPQAPLLTDEKAWEIVSDSLRNVSDEVREKFRVHMPNDYLYTFTHGDPALHNIIIKDGNVAGIIGWESSRYRPVWFESVQIALGGRGIDKEWKRFLTKYTPEIPWAQDDKEWKSLLSEYMTAFPKAQRFFVAHLSRRIAPNSSYAEKALKKLDESYD